MSTKIIFLFFILLSILLISITLLFSAKSIYLEQIEKRRILNIQKVYHKSYFRKRDIYIPERSIRFAQYQINKILKKRTIEFKDKSHLLDSNSTHPKNYKILKKIVEILNHLKKEAIVEIKTYTDKKGLKQYNLKLSQKRADEIKRYISSRSKIAFISAIGYGEEIKYKNNEKKYLEIIIKRIK